MHRCAPYYTQAASQAARPSLTSTYYSDSDADGVAAAFLALLFANNFSSRLEVSTSIGVSTSFTVSTEGIGGMEGNEGIEISGTLSLGSPKAFTASRDKKAPTAAVETRSARRLHLFEVDCRCCLFADARAGAKLKAATIAVVVVNVILA